MSWCGSIPNDGKCALVSYILWIPGVVLMAWMPSRMRVTSQFLHFHKLDAKTSVFAQCLYGICVTEAILAFAFMSRDYSCVALILCQLIVTASWLGCALILHREVWRIAEWPCHEIRAFFFANLFINLLQTVYLASPNTPILAVPVLSLLLTASGLGVSYLKELAYTPSELDQIALDRVSVDIYDGNPGYKEGLLGRQDPAFTDNVFFRLFSLGGRSEDVGVRHDWCRLDSDVGGHMEHGDSFSRTSSSFSSSEEGGGAYSRTNTSSSSSSMFDQGNQGVMRSALENIGGSLTPVRVPYKGSSSDKGGPLDQEGSPTDVDQPPPRRSVAVSRALEAQRKQQQMMASPPLKTDSKQRGTSQQQQRAGRTSPSAGVTLSVVVDTWRVRGSAASSGGKDANSPRHHGSERDSLSGSATDRESLNHSRSEDGDGDRDRDGGLDTPEEEEEVVEFGITITQLQGAQGGGMGQNKAKKREKIWTVWRTATELLDMHAQILLVRESGSSSSPLVMPRKPFFKGGVDKAKVESLAGDRKAIGIYLNTFLRGGQRERDLPPVLMSFLEIREDEALSLV